MKPPRQAIQKSSAFNPASPSVVGTIHTSGGLQAAARLSVKQLDMVEIRVDQLGRLPSPARLEKISLPKLITARDPREGGEGALDLRQREALYLAALPFAALIDLELRSFHGLRAVRREAASARIGVVASYHDFSRCPSPKRLRELLDKARGEGAAVFKVAAQLPRASDVGALLELLEHANGFPVAVMGMGPFGRASRLLLAAAGSCLVYGWLHRPQVPGQFPALLLRERLQEVLS